MVLRLTLDTLSLQSLDPMNFRSLLEETMPMFMSESMEEMSIIFLAQVRANTRSNPEFSI